MPKDERHTLHLFENQWHAGNNNGISMEQQAKATLEQQRKINDQKKSAISATNGAGLESSSGGSGTSSTPQDDRTDGSSTALFVGGVLAAGAVLALGIFAGGDKAKDIAAGESSSKAQVTGVQSLHLRLQSIALIAVMS